jgi:hypothetical protein
MQSPLLFSLNLHQIGPRFRILTIREIALTQTQAVLYPLRSMEHRDLIATSNSTSITIEHLSLLGFIAYPIPGAMNANHRSWKPTIIVKFGIIINHQSRVCLVTCVTPQARKGIPHQLHFMFTSFSHLHCQHLFSFNFKHTLLSITKHTFR